MATKRITTLDAASRTRLRIKPYTSPDLLRLRRRWNLTQAEFWAPLGVTQSGGSRYETGRHPALPVCLLVACVYEGRPLPRVGKLPEKVRKARRSLAIKTAAKTRRATYRARA